MTAPAARIAAVVLAAGEAQRYGGQKLLATLAGRPLLQHTVDAACASSLSPVVVVLGADADAIAERLDHGRARIVLNPGFVSGQSSSLRVGVNAIAAEADAAVVLLGDQPGVTPALLDALVTRHRETGALAVLCEQDGRRSPPALLHADLWPEIEALRGDVGAREILARRSGVATLVVERTLARLDDIDTHDDLARLGPVS